MEKEMIHYEDDIICIIKTSNIVWPCEIFFKPDSSIKKTTEWVLDMPGKEISDMMLHESQKFREDWWDTNYWD